MNIGNIFNLLYQVGGHSIAQTIPADDDINIAGTFGQINRALPGRVAPAYHKYFLVFTGRSFGHGGAIVNTCAGKVFNAFYIQLTIIYSGGKHYRAADDLRAVIQYNGFVTVLQGNIT